MGSRTSSPEYSGRLYFNESYSDNPAPGPLAMRALSASFARRAALARSADRTLDKIDIALDGTPRGDTPPPEAGDNSQEDLEEPIDISVRRRRKLGNAAVRADISEPHAA